MKKMFWPKFGPMGTKLILKLVFCHFFKFGSLVFSEFAYNDSLQQCLACSRSKIHEKKEKKCSPNLGQKLGFLSFSQVWFISFPQNCTQ